MYLVAMATKKQATVDIKKISIYRWFKINLQQILGSDTVFL